MVLRRRHVLTERREEPAGGDLGKLSGISGEHGLGTGSSDLGEDPGEVAGPCGSCFVDDQHGAHTSNRTNPHPKIVCEISRSAADHQHLADLEAGRVWPAVAWFAPALRTSPVGAPPADRRRYDVADMTCLLT